MSACRCTTGSSRGSSMPASPALNGSKTQPTDELAVIRGKVVEAKVYLTDQIRAPYSRMSAWATTQSCHYLEHPSRHFDAPDTCVCGKQEGWTTPPWESA